MIYAIGYDPEEKLLEVVFTKGKIWAYEDVPKDVYEKLMNSKSIGSYMRNYISAHILLPWQQQRRQRIMQTR